MKRTTVFLDDEVAAGLRALARRRRVPAAGMVREAVARYVAEELRGRQATLGFLGAGDSGRSDVAETSEEILRREWGERPAGAAAASKPGRADRRPRRG